MKCSREVLVKISKLNNLDIYLWDGRKLEVVREILGVNPLVVNKTFRNTLLQKAESHFPIMVQDEAKVLFACIRCEDTFLLAGPMPLEKMGIAELHGYYRNYGIKCEEDRELPQFLLSKALMIVSLLCSLVNGEEYTEEDLIHGNHLAKQVDQAAIEQEQIRFQIRKEQEEQYHHTYQKERMLLDCVREGKVKDALSKNMGMDIETGRLSQSEIMHWHYLVVVAITLCTRAAIEGGLSPSEAYQLSDYYIQKSEECKDITALVGWRNRAVQELTERVAEQKSRHRVSTYVEASKDYVNRHYQEKIYLEKIADRMGVSSTYLSRLFKKETGETLQDYLIRVRVERAANLLVYSEESIAHIAEYVNFPSQSYLGKMFKKYKGMTPREYRMEYKPREFSS